jgi:hypothetical protein
MAVTFNMKALSVTGFSLLAATVLWSACGEDGTPQSPRDLDEETNEASAGDGGRNTRRDSGNSGDDDDSADDDTADDDSADDDSADDDSADDDAADDDSADDDSADAGATPPRNDAGGGDAGRADAGGGGSGDCASLTYAAFGQKVIADHCATCHSGDEPVGTIALESLADIKEHADAIQEQVVDMEAMPPRNSRPMLSAANRMKIAQWLECGPN